MANCLCVHERVMCVFLFPPRCEKTRKINTKMRINSHHDSTRYHYISCKTHGAHKWPPKRRFSHIDTMPQLDSLRPGNDVTTDCATLMITSQLTLAWLEHETWLIDIDFIQGGIHSQSCKNKDLAITLSFHAGLEWYIHTLWPRQNSGYFPDDIFKWIFLNENVWISIEILLKFVPWGPIDNIPADGSGNGSASTKRQAIIWTIFMQAPVQATDLGVVW